MKIEPTMSLDHLIELMYVNGDAPPIAQREAGFLREMLVQTAPHHDWRTTSDVEDAEWFALMGQAVVRAAEGEI